MRGYSWRNFGEGRKDQGVGANVKGLSNEAEQSVRWRLKFLLKSGCNRYGRSQRATASLKKYFINHGNSSYTPGTFLKENNNNYQLAMEKYQIL